MRFSKERIIAAIQVFLVLASIINIVMISHYYRTQYQITSLNAKQNSTTSADNHQSLTSQNQNQIIISADQNLFNFIEDNNSPSTIAKDPIMPLHESGQQPKIMTEQQSKKIYKIEPVVEIDRSNITLIDNWSLIQHRIDLGKPNPPQKHLSFYIIQGSQRSHLCSMLNTVILITPSSIKLGKSILGKLEVKWLIFVVDMTDTISIQYLSLAFKQEKIGVFDVQLDYDYQFLVGLLSRLGCEKLVYINNQLELLLEEGQVIKNVVQQCQNLSVCYSSKAIEKNAQEQKQVDLVRLEVAELSTIKSMQYSKYVFVIDTRYFHFISPLNFLYFSRFSFEEIILVPALAMSQKISRLVPFMHVIHKYGQLINQFKYFQLNHPSTDNSDFCFVSYSQNPYIQQKRQLERYLDGVQKIAAFNSNISVIIYLPYGQTSRTALIHNSLYKLYKLKKEKLIKKFRVILKARKVASSLSVYQSIHNYCSLNSVVIVSRHSTELSEKLGEFMKQILMRTDQSVFVGYRNGDKEILKDYLRKQKYNEFYRQHFFNLQIFKSEIFRKIHYIYLKKGELDFFQSEYSFVLPLLKQAGQENILCIDAHFYKSSTRKQSPTELKQLQLIKYEYSHMNQTFYYNFLLNEAFNPTTKPKIEKKLHFVSIQDISNLSPKLKDYLRIHYSDFQIHTWGITDVIKGDFPLTSFKLNQMIERQENSYQDIKLLMGLEAIYSHGGFLVPQYSPIPKHQSLTQFLRYEFFLGWRASQSQLQGSYPIIGSVKNNYHLSILLKQILPITFNEFKTIQLLEQIFNQKQRLTGIGYGYSHMFEQSVQKCRNFASSSNLLDSPEGYSLSICT